MQMMLQLHTSVLVLYFRDTHNGLQDAVGALLLQQPTPHAAQGPASLRSLPAPASLSCCDHPIPILQPKFPGSQLTDHHVPVSPLCLLYPGPRSFLQPRMGSSVRPKLHLPSQPTLGPSCHLLPIPAPRTFWSHGSNCSKRSQPGEIPQKLQEEQGIQTETPRCVQISPLAAGHELSEV